MAKSENKTRLTRKMWIRGELVVRTYEVDAKGDKKAVTPAAPVKSSEKEDTSKEAEASKEDTSKEAEASKEDTSKEEEKETAPAKKTVAKKVVKKNTTEE